MTHQLDEARLRELAEAAFELGEIVAAAGEPAWYDDDSATMGGRIPDVDAALIAAANPATILALLNALSAERERADRAEADKADMQRRLDRWEPKPFCPPSLSSFGGVRCNELLKALGGAYPRTCMICRLGPCTQQNIPHLATQSTSRTGEG